MTIQTRRIIKTDGHEIALPNKLCINEIARLIGAHGLDTVSIRPDRTHVMLVDDVGHLRDLPVNVKATSIYLAQCIPGAMHTIRGDVAIVPDADFADGI